VGVGHSQLAALARRQHGLVTRAQVLRVLSRGQLDRRVRTGALEHVRTNVYRVAGTPESWVQHVFAACLSAGEGSVASFATAARIWGLPGFATFDEIHVTTPSRRRKRIPGVTVHDSQVLHSRHVTTLGGVPITTPARTLCDLTGSYPPWQVEHALDDSLRRRLCSLNRMMRVFVDLATRGRRRSTVMRALLDERMSGFHAGDSRNELRLARWLAAAGLPRPVQQYRVRLGGKTRRLDLAYPPEKIDIEYDGWDTHRVRSAFDSDRERDMLLELDGWLVLRFTSRQGRATVVERVARALAARDHPPSM